MDGTSLNIVEEKINSLKEVLPEVFSEGKIDWEKLKATLGEHINFSNERYVLNWAGKSDAFKILQVPTTQTLIPTKEEGIDFDQTRNIFIGGENMEVLKVLQKSYFGKIKVIYIDPPYNTGNDSFIYPDKFSETKSDYEKRVGDKDEEGYLTKEGMFRKNSKENGQYHSNWLSMMMPRLYLAKNLLRKDGVIFISIDDNEVHNLRLLMNEIFGEENFLGEFVWKRRASSALADKYISMDHEYVISYQKGEMISFNGIEKDYSAYKNPDNDPRGVWTLGDLTVGMTSTQRPNQFYPLVDPKTNRKFQPNPNRVWAYIPSSMQKLLDENRIFFPDNTSLRPMMKRFKSELKSSVNPISTLLSNVGMNSEGTKDLRELLGNTVFTYSKPLSLIKELIKQACSDEDITLDFFSGSGTTAHAVMDLNKEDGGHRKYICVQLPELCDEKSEAYKAGYKTISDIAKERIRRAGKKIKSEIQKKIETKETKIKELQGQLPTEEVKSGIKKLKSEIEQLKSQDLGFKVFQLTDSNFKQWQQVEGNNTKGLVEQMELFVDPVAESSTIENMVYELLLKSGKNLNSKIEKKNYCYYINEGELVLILEKATQEIMDAVKAEHPKKVIALDRIFEGNDQLKTNTVLQMKDAGVEFKTI